MRPEAVIDTHYTPKNRHFQELVLFPGRSIGKRSLPPEAAEWTTERASKRQKEERSESDIEAEWLDPSDDEGAPDDDEALDDEEAPDNEIAPGSSGAAPGHDGQSPP